MFKAIQRGTVEEANKRYRLRAQLNQVPEQHSSSESIIVLSSSDSTSHPSSSRLLQTSEHEASGGNIRLESEEQPAEVDEANGGRPHSPSGKKKATHRLVVDKALTKIHISIARKIEMHDSVA
ncbi:hypothetical protein C0Q70_15238 [Pomacea canaliculata]|uniref:Uncharacterized protein n=1 Tax=Pomacea canaliculata TaxID=400727 RepID=A0A2T7NUB7_POMCA|nr:hypothetical protein C0Q70_15238 [Pomacea canaliculata]